MRWVGLIGLGVLAGAISAGCGGEVGPALVPVTGTVTVDGAPAKGAALTFVPQDGTPGRGGSARAGPDGKYEAQDASLRKGLEPGGYKVVVNWRLLPSGEPDNPDTPPIESQASEQLPPEYSDRDATKLTAQVAPGAGPIDFALKGAKKAKK